MQSKEPGHELKKPRADQHAVKHRVYPGERGYQTPSMRGVTTVPWAKPPTTDQELTARVAALEAQVESQQEQIEDLNARLTVLEGGSPPIVDPPDPPIEPPTDGPVVLFEDICGDKLDQDKWFTRYIFTGPDGPGTLDYLNDEWERYRETGNHVLNGSELRLNSLPHNGEFWPSGMIRSKELFDLASGEEFYFEARVKSPRGLGVWPAFWLAADARPPDDINGVRWPPEIDMMEIVNNGQDDTTMMLHCGCIVHDWQNNPQKYEWKQTADNFNGEWSYWYAPFDFADDFHTIALRYQRPNFTIYCDGGLILSGIYDWVWDDGSPAPPAHVLLNLGIGGSWAGRYGVDNDAFPQALEIDFVRVLGSQLLLPLPRSVIGKDYEVT